MPTIARAPPPGPRLPGLLYLRYPCGRRADAACARVCLEVRGGPGLRVSGGLERLSGGSRWRGYLHSSTPSAPAGSRLAAHARPGTGRRRDSPIVAGQCHSGLYIQCDLLSSIVVTHRAHTVGLCSLCRSAPQPTSVTHGATGTRGCRSPLIGSHPLSHNVRVGPPPASGPHPPPLLTRPRGQLTLSVSLPRRPRPPDCHSASGPQRPVSVELPQCARARPRTASTHASHCAAASARLGKPLLLAVSGQVTRSGSARTV